MCGNRGDGQFVEDCAFCAGWAVVGWRVRECQKKFWKSEYWTKNKEKTKKEMTAGC